METLALDAFVPDVIRRRVAIDRPPTGPVVERFPAALLLADLSGFSTLAENLSRRGPRGAEDLKDLLNLFFGRLVELVHGHGGQVLTFPGDAILALWPADDGDVTSAARLAAQCALEAQRTMALTRGSDVRLQMRAGIGAGEMWVATLGGVSGRWELLVAGSPLEQVAQAISAINPGEVAISSAAHERLAPFAKVADLTGKSLRLISVSAPSAGVPRDPLPLDAAASSRLRAYVPRSVQASLDAGQTDWLAEFRRVSVLFIKIGALDAGVDETTDQLQRAVVAVQTAVYRYGGAINQLLADDKGMVVVCGWGFALHAHEDDEVRAVRAALDLRRNLNEIGVPASFGLATGEVFTGLRGNRHRCEYAMIGDVVNIAARLMDAADGGIFCDLASCEGAARRIEFEALLPIRVKGREQAVGVFRPLQVSATRPTEIVGRVAGAAGAARTARRAGCGRPRRRRGHRRGRRDRQEPSRHRSHREGGRARRPGDRGRRRRDSSDRRPIIPGPRCSTISWASTKSPDERDSTGACSNSSDPRHGCCRSRRCSTRCSD